MERARAKTRSLKNVQAVEEFFFLTAGVEKTVGRKQSHDSKNPQNILASPLASKATTHQLPVRTC